MRTMPTRRQLLTAAAYGFCDSRVRPTHAELAKRFGVSRPAITRRLQRFEQSLAAEQRERYFARIKRRGRRARVYPIQLSLTA